MIRGILVVLLAGMASSRGVLQADDWKQYNFDNRGWRFNAGENILSPENVSELTVLWRCPSDKSRIGKVHATPVVVDDCVYFGTATEPAFYRLKPSGAVDWIFRNTSVDGQPFVRSRISPWDTRELTAGGFYTSPLVVAGSVYVGDTSGFLYCLDSQTGQQRWRIDTRDAASFPFPHVANQTLGSPISADGKIIFVGGAFEHDLGRHEDYKCCTGRGFVVAVTPETGDFLWAFVLGPKPEQLEPPVVINDSWGEHVFQFGPSTSSIWSTPSYDEESKTLFFGTDTNNSPRQPTDADPRLDTPEACAVVALDVRNGSRKWATQLNPGDVWNYALRSYKPETGQYLDCSIGDTPKIYKVDIEGQLTKVVGVGCKNGAFYVLHAADGRIFQHTPVYTGTPTDPPSPKPDPRTLALPSVLGGLQTGCATDGKSVFTNGVDWMTGLTAGKVEPPPEYLGPPTGGRVTSISLDTRAENWRYETPKLRHELWDGSEIGPPVCSGIAVANGVVFFTTLFGNQLIALNAETGEELFNYNLPDVICGPSVANGRVYVGVGECVFDLKIAENISGGIICLGLPTE